MPNSPFSADLPSALVLDHTHSPFYSNNSFLPIHFPLSLLPKSHSTDLPLALRHVPEVLVVDDTLKDLHVRPTHYPLHFLVLLLQSPLR